MLLPDMSGLPFDIQLSAALLLEDPLSAGSQQQIDQLVSLLQQAKTIDYRKMPFGRQPEFYITRIREYLDTLLRYTATPKPEIAGTFEGFIPQVREALSALQKKHPKLLRVSERHATFVNPNGEGTYLSWHWLSWTQEYTKMSVRQLVKSTPLGRILQVFDDFFRSDRYVLWNETVAKMKELGGRSLALPKRDTLQIKTPFTSIEMYRIGYVGEVLRPMTTMPEVKEVEEIPTIELGWHRQIRIEEAGLTYLDELVDTIDTVLYVLKTLESYGSKFSLAIAPLGDDTLEYGVTMSRATRSYTFHSSDVTSPKKLLLQITEGLRQAMAGGPA